MNKTIYIRKEDLELWDKIEDKPAFIHYCLQEFKSPLAQRALKEAYEGGGTATREMVVQSYDHIKKAVKETVKKGGPCEHGYARGLCKYAKCNKS